MEKSEQRKKEDRELLDRFVKSIEKHKSNSISHLEQFKKDNDLLPSFKPEVNVGEWDMDSKPINETIRFKDEPNENITFEKFGKHTYKLDWSTFDGKNVQGVRVPSVSKLQKKLDKIQKQIDKLK